MSENLYSPPSSPMPEVAGLGDVMFRVKDRSQKDMMIAMGQSLVQIWFLTLWVSLFSSLVILACFLPFLEKRATPEMFRVRQIGIAAIFLTVLGLWIWYQLRHPQRGALTLYERGFRYKRQQFRFDEVASIHSGKAIGGVMSAVLSTNRFIGHIKSANRNAADRIEFAYAASMTVILKNGSRKALDGLTIRCEPEPLQRFFELLATRHPEVQLDLKPMDLLDEDARRPEDTTENFFDGPARKFRDI